MPMIRIQRSALLPYPAEHLYQLVCDIPEYPTFIGGCSAARIVRTWEQGVEAELTIGAMGGNYSFSTRNTLVEPREIIMELIDGPLQHLVGRWVFSSLADSAAKVSLDLQFETSGPLQGFAAKQVAERVSTSVVDAIIRRAHSALGGGHW